MELFDMVKAAPPPQAISVPVERISTPSPIPPDSPDAIDDDLPASVEVNDEENKEDNIKKKKAKDKECNDDDDEEDDKDGSPFKIPARSQMDSPPLLKQKPEEASPFKLPKKLQKYKLMEENVIYDAQEEKEEKLDDADNQLETQQAAFKKPKGPTKRKHTEEDTETSQAETETEKSRKKRASEELDDNDDSDASSDGHPKAMPTKTKAQQKMFSDLPDQSASQHSTTQDCVIRIMRLSQSKIDAACESVSKSSFADPNDSITMTRKRGRPRLSNEDKKSKTKPRKLKTSPSPKIHIKVPLQYGAKKRALQNLARARTPPPSRLKARKPPKGRPPASPAMIRRYGARVFNCVVRLKKTLWPPSKSPVRNPRPLLTGAHKDRPRKSNLSVSFSEAVEILGSNEGGSRRSTFGTISSKSPKPTRLQRVDATGNVLEDIALTSSLLFSENAAASSSGGSGSPRGKGKRRSCNGSPRLKRPNQRIPLSGLASLRLDDGPKSDDDGEYIVPNELPGMQRPGTPPPKKKKISFTTTISDDEDEKQQQPTSKKTKDASAAKKEAKSKPKPNSKKVEKSSSLKESVLQKGLLQEAANEIVTEKLKEAAVVCAEEKEAAQVAEDEVTEVAAKISEVAEANKEENEEESKKIEDLKPADVAEKDPKEGEETEEIVKIADAAAAEEETQNEDISETLEMSVLEVTRTESDEVSQPEGEDDGAEQEKVNDVEAEDIRELVTPSLQPLPLPLPPTTEENQDDVLEIQTSLEDVRQLHTPFSSQQSTPQQNTPQAPKRVRLDSGDSDCSFKSAAEPSKDPMPGGDKTPETHLVAATDIDLVSTPRPVNGCDTASDTTFYSPLESMPALDDVVLGELVETDFQLNSSRHAISRGTLDDIMTALES